MYTRSIAAAILLSCLGPWGFGVCWADTITLDGQRHENVYVTKTGSMYYVKFPKTGEVESIGKDRVPPDGVAISKDEAYREKLLAEYKKNRKRREASAPKKRKAQEGKTKHPGGIRKEVVKGQATITNKNRRHQGNSNHKVFFDENGVPLLTNLPEKYENSDAYIEATLGFKAINVPEQFRRWAGRAPSPGYTGAYDGESIRDIVLHYANYYELEPSLIYAVIKAESNFNPNAVSPKGARGLMQLIPSTAAEMGVTDVFDPVENIAAGTQYLRKMLDFCGGRVDLALAAYNAGPGNVRKHGFKIPPFPETQAYVPKVLRYRREYGGGEIRLAKASSVARSYLPPRKATGKATGKTSGKGYFTIVFRDGLTQPAEEIKRKRDLYYIKYENNIRAVLVTRVQRIIKPA